MKYYNRIGEDRLFTDGAFVKEYEDSYYLDQNEETRIPRVSVNSRFVEEKIEEILKRGISNEKDVDLILAWKIGGIDHINSKNSVEYKSGWKDKGEVKERYFKCDRTKYTAFCKYIVDVAKSAESESPEELLEKILNKNKVTGIGPVYLLTLLFFLTKGSSPIFDRFAYTAVKAIYNETMPDKVWYENPSKNGKNDILLVLNEYKWYLEKVFGTASISRNVDRALWVYGHQSYTSR